MSAQFMQYLLTGLTVGAIYALVALGFSIIFNASHVINFAQGEFVMIGGMATVSLTGAGLPYMLAIPVAVVAAALVGLALEKFAVEPAQGASVVTLVIITIGASIFLRGLAMVVWDKRLHALKPFTGDTPIAIAGATILPQSLWCSGSPSPSCSRCPVFRAHAAGEGDARDLAQPPRGAARGINVRMVLVCLLRPFRGVGRDCRHPDRADHDHFIRSRRDAGPERFRRRDTRRPGQRHRRGGRRVALALPKP